MGASLSTVSAITKEVYGPRIVDQLENETTLVKRMDKSSQGVTSEVGGKYVTFPLKVRRNSGISYRDELSQLAPAGQQGWTSVRVPLRYGYGRVYLSGQTIELVDENYQAFASAMTEEMTGLKNDIQKDTNRILWGNGLGVLGTVDAAATSATQSVGADADAVKYFDMDMIVDVCSAAGVPVAGGTGLKIIGIDEAAGNITLSASVTTVVGGVITRTGNYGKEPQGLTSLVSNSNAELFNLSSDDEPTWTSYVDSTGGALSESNMIKTCDVLRTKGGRPTAIWADLGTRRAYFNLLTTQRRFTGTKDFNGGFTGMAFSYDTDIPLMTDVDAPKGGLWFLNEDTFKIYRSKPWYFEDKDGSVWKWVTDYDAFQAMMKQYWEFALDRRNVNARMTGITPG